MKKIYILLGGVLGGIDGWVDSTGMVQLATFIQQNVPDVEIKTQPWGDYMNVITAINYDHTNKKNILIGFSGGGSRITWVANRVRQPIELMVSYDASLAWEVEPVGENVKHLVQYYNTRNRLLNFGLGGGYIKAKSDKTKNDVYKVKTPHLKIQFNNELHNITLKAVKEV